MAYTNTVGIMPGGATEKLPFIHSDFKARSKIARCIGGFRKHANKFHSGSSNGVPATTREGHTGTRAHPKLPQIYYSGGDQRTLITWGCQSRAGKAEYPGFVGNKRVLKKKDFRHTNHPGQHAVHSTNYGCSSNVATTTPHGSWLHNSNSTMRSYLSLPNLNLVHKNGAKGSNVTGVNSWRWGSKGRQRQRGDSFDDDYDDDDDDDDDEDRLINGVEGQHLDSLIFVDEEMGKPSHQAGVGDRFVVGQTSHPYHNASRVTFHESCLSDYHQMSAQTCPDGNNQTTTPAEMDSFAKGVDEKLREDKGKSGMKRERPRHARDGNQVRILGDVVTAERMHQLLKPRRDGEELTFT